MEAGQGLLAHSGDTDDLGYRALGPRLPKALVDGALETGRDPEPPEPFGKVDEGEVEVILHPP